MAPKDNRARDNSGRFSGLAGIYDASRPDYPAAALAAVTALLDRPSLPPFAADVGAGTGISTRAIAAALPGWRVLAVEPNADMAETARAALAGLHHVALEIAAAERLPVADGACGLVTVAQALHWFDRPVFYAQARRVLATGGVLAILNNNRRTADSPALSAVEDFLEAENPGYTRHYRAFDIAAELAAAPGFSAVSRTLHPWMRTVTADSLTQYFLSRSWSVPVVAKLGAEATRARVAAIITAAAGAAPFDIPFDCEVVTARKG